MEEHISISSSMDIYMPRMAFHRHVIAYITLGLLCGWYYVICLLYPILLFLAVRGSMVAGTIFAIFIGLTIIPLKNEPWDFFTNSLLFDIWKEYFAYSYDDAAIQGKLNDNQKYMFLEFPHGIFPMAQFVSVSEIPKITPNKGMRVLGASIVFYFPIMRHIKSWIGAMAASRHAVTKVFDQGHHCVILPGGIAEMFVTSPDAEVIYLKKRYTTIELCIQQGAHIVPVFFYGNSMLFDVPSSLVGPQSWLAAISRKFRASLIFFYGRHYLPVPYRHPLHMAFGEVIEVQQHDQPTKEQVEETLQKVVDAVQHLYYKNRPIWETRPIVVV